MTMCQGAWYITKVRMRLVAHAGYAMMSCMSILLTTLEGERLRFTSRVAVKIGRNAFISKGTWP